VAVGGAQSSTVRADGELLPPDADIEARDRRDLALKPPFESERGFYGSSICLDF